MEWYVFITELIEDLRSLNISIVYLLRQLFIIVIKLFLFYNFSLQNNSDQAKWYFKTTRNSLFPKYHIHSDFQD